MKKIEKKLKKFLKNDIEFKKLFEKYMNRNFLKENKLNFKKTLNLFLFENDILQNPQLFLDKYYIDISYIEIDNKIINLDFLYNEFKNWDY